jgi:hypothetical protein
LERLYEIDVSVPAGTLSTAPATFPLPLEESTLKKIEITIPSGHNGLTGIRVTWSGQQIIPWGNNSFLVANGQVIAVDFDDYMTAKGVVISAYNTDVYVHKFYVRATISDLPSTPQLVRQTGPGKAIVPATPVTALDPLSPDALLASVPDDVRALIMAGNGASLP